jgi:uncharacterized membrane protein YjdF
MLEQASNPSGSQPDESAAQNSIFSANISALTAWSFFMIPNAYA